ncbi:[citrate (pro-3S)-lyase] ligase [Fructobacillus sp. M1-13]|uniref:[Citrate [pro-3S]-lyase] ligase n=1 Tax=Fructobacillus papyriferae TaxID=2713171 RepID=A0ABS5QNW3_9LACO|nr:[citrate (pro-3S)-lyase] ligase [Fructobacillus papyriferae]MBS9334552.1 [citrate (pro-3S)-lyase] ligase [Fructobacillus papyriferae]MCD2158541.1 [citrate (pro-3S)-lyase] ligase [Fructobacillus papyriferae]
MTDKVAELYLFNPRVKKTWQTFLTKKGIPVFSDQEVDQIDQTIGLFDEKNRLVGTGSIAGETIKYIAVEDEPNGPAGARFNQLVSSLEASLAQSGHFHLFVFTKPTYEHSFAHVGFNTLAKTKQGLILEKGTPNIQSFREQLPKKPNTAKRVAAVVLNANPFTKGHRYLVEQAAKENDWVYVFVVNQDVSLFTTKERLALVERGLSDVKNVCVANGGDYMVSYLSFPAYFIKDHDRAISYQTTLDAELFKEQIAGPLGIQVRYVGTEPDSPTTKRYNEALQAVLPKEVLVKEVPRLTQADGKQAVSASSVRQAIKDNQFSSIVALVPKTTAHFINEHWQTLRGKMMKGQNQHAD